MYEERFPAVIKREVGALHFDSSDNDSVVRATSKYPGRLPWSGVECSLGFAELFHCPVVKQQLHSNIGQFLSLCYAVRHGSSF
jgi:hypothetical protein